MFGEQLGTESKLWDNSYGFCEVKKGLGNWNTCDRRGCGWKQEVLGGGQIQGGLIVGRVQCVDAGKLKRNKKKQWNKNKYKEINKNK